MFDDKYAEEMLRYQVEGKEKWKDWIHEMLGLHFKPEWEVSIIPPFAEALARFRVTNNDKWVSVYFDAYDRLGFMGEPYFEIYPNKNDDCSRYLPNETDEMMKEIDEILTA